MVVNPLERCQKKFFDNVLDIFMDEYSSFFTNVFSNAHSKKYFNAGTFLF